MMTQRKLYVKQLAITPTKKDYERAISARRQSSRQVRAGIERIGSVEKALQRGLAFNRSQSYDRYASDFRHHAVRLGATQAQLDMYDAELEVTRIYFSDAFEAKQAEERKVIGETIPEGYAKGLNSAVLYRAKIKSKNRIGHIYTEFFQSTFHMNRFVFVERYTDKRYNLGETSQQYGNDLYKEQVNVIKEYKVKPAE